MTRTLETGESYRDRVYRLLEEPRPWGDAGPSWTHPVRREALQSFGRMGFPTFEDEAWKYTRIEPVIKLPYVAPSGGRRGLPAAAAESLSRMGGYLAVFSGGRLSDGQTLPRLPDGIRVGSLAQAMREVPERVRPYWSRLADYRNEPFAALNTALMQDGAFVHIPDGVVLDQPICLAFVAASADGQPTVVYPRNLIVLGKNTRATIIEAYLGTDDEVYFTNAVSEVFADEGTVLRHYRWQRESVAAYHVATVQFHLARQVDLSSHSLSFGGALVRNNLNVALKGEGASCSLDGLYLTSGTQHVDHHTRVDHETPFCSSRQCYKGVLGGKSTGVFDGRIVVHAQARRTDAHQSNKNLLLSEDAHVNTKPQLEIHADDVTCTHGSTIGPPEADSLFYLRSRGIDGLEAQLLLAYAFGCEVLDRIEWSPFRELQERLFWSGLQSAAGMAVRGLKGGA